MPSSKEIFNAFPGDSLVQMIKQEKISGVDVTDSKSKLVEAIAIYVEDLGTTQVVSRLSLVDLETLCEPLNIDHEGNNVTKTVLQKRLKEKICEMGIQEFLKNHTDEKTILFFLEAHGVAQAGDKFNNQVQLASNLIIESGATAFISRFDVRFLQDLMEDMNLKCSTTSKNKIVDAIIHRTSAKAEVVQKEEIVFSEKKLTIAEGITYQDIFQHYYLEEIQDWCRANGLKVSGTKAVVIKRILAYFDGDKENTMASENVPTKKKEVTLTKVQPKTKEKVAASSPQKKASAKVNKKATSAANEEDDDEQTSSSQDVSKDVENIRLEESTPVTKKRQGKTKN